MDSLTTALTALGSFVVACYSLSLIFVVGGYGLSRLVAPLRPMDDAQRTAFEPVKHGPLTIMRGLLAEGLFQLITVTSDIVRLFTGARRLAALPSGTPVVLLPGYLESTGCMVYLGHWLRGRGYRVFLVEYPSTFAAIADNARAVHQRIEAICQETGAESVAIVGHSMGGVIARCIVHTEEQHHIHTIVCIASPHQGVTRRAFAPGRSARDMTFGSRHMHAFPIDKRGDVPIHTVVGVLDQIVNPPWACLTAEGQTHVLQTAIGHMGPLFILEAREAVEGYLRREDVKTHPA